MAYADPPPDSCWHSNAPNPTSWFHYNFNKFLNFLTFAHIISHGSYWGARGLGRLSSQQETGVIGYQYRGGLFAIIEIDAVKKIWRLTDTLIPQTVERLARSVIVTSAGASNRIEGNRLTDAEVGALYRPPQSVGVR